MQTPDAHTSSAIAITRAPTFELTVSEIRLLLAFVTTMLVKIADRSLSSKERKEKQMVQWRENKAGQKDERKGSDYRESRLPLLFRRTSEIVSLLTRISLKKLHFFCHVAQSLRSSSLSLVFPFF